MLTATGLASTASSVPLATSGSRLLLGQVNALGVPIFGYVSAAGSATPQTAADVTLATATPASGPQVFAQSADGAIFWSYLSLSRAPSGPGPITNRAVKGYFLVGNSEAQVDPMAGLAPQGRRRERAFGRSGRHARLEDRHGPAAPQVYVFDPACAP